MNTQTHMCTCMYTETNTKYKYAHVTNTHKNIKSSRNNRKRPVP